MQPTLGKNEAQKAEDFQINSSKKCTSGPTQCIQSFRQAKNAAQPAEAGA